jgi:regulation of enolase protein 1 (concanavalin A-like superfamily)
MSRYLGFALLVVILFTSAGLQAAAIQLPKTGQTSCWDDSGNVIACTGTGQDGEKQTGAAWPTPRFLDNGNGTITDNFTGLVWLKNANCQGIMSWQQALDASNTLASGSCGLTDGSTAGQWRLPNRRELLSLQSYQQANGTTWLSSQGFSNAQSDWYWTSDTYLQAPGQKWLVHTVGAAWTQSEVPAASGYFVLPVRGPVTSGVSVAPPSKDFGSLVIGQSSSQTFTISNSGSAPLPLTMSLTGADSAMFSINPGNGAAGTCGSLTPTIGAAASCTVAVLFSPTTVGVKAANLSVVPGAPGVPAVNVALAGSSPTQVTVTASTTGGSIVSTNPLVVSSGASAAFTVDPGAGNQPSNTVNGSCPVGSFNGNTYTILAVTADCSVILSVVPITYTISTATVGSGSIVCTPNTVGNAGSSISCLVTPAAGSNIGSVTVDGTSQSIGNPSSFTYQFAALSANHSMVASFTSVAGVFTEKDIGSVALAGKLTYASGVYSLSGSGVDIWGTADAFGFGYQTLSGDGQITARVASVQNTNAWAKAGVMIRETLAANSANAMMQVTPGNGANFQRRLTTGASSVLTGPKTAKAPYWVRLVRKGNTFSGYASADGVTWTLVGSDTINMASSVYVGLAVTSHNSAALCAATFDGIGLVSVTSPTVSLTTPAAGATFSAPASINMIATATPSTGASINKVDFYAGTTLVGTATTSPYSVSWGNVPAGSYALTAKVLDTLNQTATSSPVTVSVVTAGGGLPSPWVTSDIGSVGVAGKASYLNGVYSVSGSGSDIWGSADSFRYLYHTMTGDGQIVARVATLQNTNAYAKGGLMIRETLTAGSSYAMAAFTPTSGTTFQRRLTTGSFYLATTGPVVTVPGWIKLVRSGNTFSGYFSTDGVTWVLAGSDTIAMQSTVYVGLALTSHNNAVLGTASFDNVQ